LGLGRARVASPFGDGALQEVSEPRERRGERRREPFERPQDSQRQRAELLGSLPAERAEKLGERAVDEDGARHREERTEITDGGLVGGFLEERRRNRDADDAAD